MRLYGRLVSCGSFLRILFPKPTTHPSVFLPSESYPYPHIDDRYLYSKMRHSLSSSCGMSSTFLKSPCTAKCPNVGINFDNTIHDGSVSHLAEGFQEWSRRDCVGESQTSRITYSHHREKCSIFCRSLFFRGGRGSPPDPL